MSMRVSTALIFDRGLARISEQQSAALTTQQQLATGRRVLKPSDDPIASSRAVETSQSLALNAGYGKNQAAATESLALSESALASAGDVLQHLRTLLVQAGNSPLTDTDRRSIADEMDARVDELIGLANSRDGAGGFLFAGYAERTQPFARTATGAVYAGDEGRRQLQLGPARTIDVTEPGSTIFERIRAGNGTFTTAATAGNTGGGVISAGSVVDRSALTASTYRLQFSVTGATTTYDVIDVTNGTTLSTGNAFTPNGAITVAGMQVTVSGSPATGDRFTLAPSGTQGVFTTLANAIAAVRGASGTAAERAAIAQGVATGLTNIDQAHDQLLSVRTSLGARLRETEALGELQQDLALQYTARLSDLRDVDYAKAASDLARQQQGLEAAWSSYQRITKLTLFDFI
jgi:flagellar hook-associated protein 3 FlgL